MSIIGQVSDGSMEGRETPFVLEPKDTGAQSSPTTSTGNEKVQGAEPMSVEELRSHLDSLSDSQFQELAADPSWREAMEHAMATNALSILSTVRLEECKRLEALPQKGIRRTLDNMCRRFNEWLLPKPLTPILAETMTRELRAGARSSLSKKPGEKNRAEIAQALVVKYLGELQEKTQNKVIECLLRTELERHIREQIMKEQAEMFDQTQPPKAPKRATAEQFDDLFRV